MGITSFGKGDELSDLLSGSNIQRNIFAEELDYDVEKDKSSEISLFPEGGKILKVKERRLDKAVYEAFMMDLWKNIFDAYSEKSGLNLNAPRFHKLGYDFDNFISYTLMEFCRGKPIKKIQDQSKKVNFEDEKIRLSSMMMYFLGALQSVKREERLVHSDYDQRHVLFFKDTVGGKYDSLSVIDLENAHLTDDYDEVLAEEKSFQDLVFRMFPGSEEEIFYHRGSGRISPLRVRDETIQRTTSAFNRKIWKNSSGAKVVFVDPVKRSVTYKDKDEVGPKQQYLFKELDGFLS